MSATKKICITLIAAAGPLTTREIADKAGVPLDITPGSLYALEKAGVVRKDSDQRPHTYVVADVDAVKRRAAGGMQGVRKMPEKAAGTTKKTPKRRKPAKTKPPKRAVRTATEFPDDRYQVYIDQDGDLQIIDRENPDVSIQMARSEAWKLANFLVGQRHLIEPTRRKGARR